MEMVIKDRFKNDAGVLFARRGVWKKDGQTSVFTHRSKKTGKFFGEGILAHQEGRVVIGAWVDPEEVKWLD